jgi:hypothetical protein
MPNDEKKIHQPALKQLEKYLHLDVDDEDEEDDE